MFFFIEFEKLYSDSFGQRVDSFLMLSFAFEEKDEIEDKKEKAEDSQKDPESRQGEDVDEHYR